MTDRIDATTAAICTWPSCGHTAKGQCGLTMRVATIAPRSDNSEVLRLRADLAEMTRRRDEWRKVAETKLPEVVAMIAERDALRAEVERLRRHLLAIQNAPKHHRGDWYEMVEWMCAHARAALGDKEASHDR
jgi:hypothetical protein